jgi:iron complex transport system substrate-binding protein
VNRRHLPALLLGALLLAACSPPPARRAGPPQRIVSLSPNLTETLFALGLGERVVGVTAYCAYPPEAANLPRVGGQMDANPEAIAALRPDLVVLFDYQEKIGRQVAAIGTPTLIVPGKSLDDILALVERLGEACAVPDNARRLRADMETRIQAVRRRVAERPRPGVLVSVDRPPGKPVGSLYLAGDDGYFDTLIDYAGGRNVCAGIGIAYPLIPAESIAEMNPDVIIDLCTGAVGQGHRPETLAADWAVLRGVEAVKTGRVHVLTETYATVPGPRTVDFLEHLAALLHPAEAQP